VSDIEVSQQVSADSRRVYDLVSDLPRMGQWSPENTGGRWIDGAAGAALGAKFKGSNRQGFRRWSTVVTVIAAEPGKRFAFDVHTGPVHVSTWDYRFVEDGSGCRVVESWTDRRPGWMKLVAVPVTGVKDRGAHNRRNMEVTLAALKQAAESQTR
jgi:hypothetical protein